MDAFAETESRAEAPPRTTERRLGARAKGDLRGKFSLETGRAEAFLDLKEQGKALV